MPAPRPGPPERPGLDQARASRSRRGPDPRRPAVGPGSPSAAARPGDPRRIRWRSRVRCHSYSRRRSAQCPGDRPGRATDPPPTRPGRSRPVRGSRRRPSRRRGRPAARRPRPCGRPDRRRGGSDPRPTSAGVSSYRPREDDDLDRALEVLERDDGHRRAGLGDDRPDAGHDPADDDPLSVERLVAEVARVGGDVTGRSRRRPRPAGARRGTARAAPSPSAGARGSASRARSAAARRARPRRRAQRRTATSGR